MTGHDQTHGHQHPTVKESAAGAPEGRLDPVCGMTVSVEPPPERRAEHDGTTYWFCSANCRRKFVEKPQQYLHPKAETRPGAAADTRIYTCPMHPQIRQAGPGSCPICGMALEPV